MTKNATDLRKGDRIAARELNNNQLRPATIIEAKPFRGKVLVTFWHVIEGLNSVMILEADRELELAA